MHTVFVLIVAMVLQMSSNTSSNMSGKTCYHCGETGHIRPMCPHLRKPQQMPAQSWQQSRFAGQNLSYGGPGQVQSEVERLIVGNAGSREVKLELVVQEKDLKHVRERLAQPIDTSPSMVDTMNAHLGRLWNATRNAWEIIYSVSTAGLGLVQPKPKVDASPSKGELLTAINNNSVQINARLDSSDTARKALSLRIDGILERVTHLEDTGTTLFVDMVGIPDEFVNLEDKRNRTDGHEGSQKTARGGGAPRKRVVQSDSDSEGEDKYWEQYTESTFLPDAEKFVGDVCVMQRACTLRHTSWQITKIRNGLRL